SGHATFGGAIFEVLRRFFGTDQIKFSFMSDEFNGMTLPANSSTARPKVTRTFNTLTDAEKENAQSRIYLGIHWQFDADDGIDLGRQVGKYVFEHAFQKK
ncbi:MAG: chloroperoxidase, partial [Chthoniobacterales bacterium]